MRSIRENIGLAIMALVIALLMKGYVWYIDPPMEVNLTIPIQARNLKAGLNISSIIPSRVDMTIKGPKSKVERFTEREFFAVANCVNVSTEGNFEIPIKISRGRSSGVKYYLEPESVHLIVGLHEEKYFDPQSKTIGELKASRVLSKIEGLPQTVRASGTAKVLERIDKVMYTLNLDQPVDVWTEDVTFIAFDAQGTPLENVQLDPPHASITVYLRELKVRQQLPVVLRVRGTPATNYVIESQSINPTQVEVIGEPAAIGSITSIDTESISVAGATSDIVREINLVSPDPRVTLQPSKVNVNIVIAQVSSRRDIENIQIELKRKKDGYSYKLEPSDINVRVQGPIERIGKLDVSLIRLSIDVSIYDIGTYTVTLDPPGLPSEINLVSMTPADVKLTVSKISDTNND